VEIAEQIPGNRVDLGPPFLANSLLMFALSAVKSF
jgi:hypothetical protein